MSINNRLQYRSLLSTPIYSCFESYRLEKNTILLTYICTLDDFSDTMEQVNEFSETELLDLWEIFLDQFQDNPNLHILRISIDRVQKDMPYDIKDIKLEDYKVDDYITVNVRAYLE